MREGVAVGAVVRGVHLVRVAEWPGPIEQHLHESRVRPNATGGGVPLAEAVLSLWRWVADPLFLLSVFTRQRGLGYEKEISFGVLVQLIAGALLEHQGSGRKPQVSERRIAAADAEHGPPLGFDLHGQD